MEQGSTRDSGRSQADKFKEAAEDHFCDPDEKRWEDRLRKVVKHKPKEEKPAD